MCWSCANVGQCALNKIKEFSKKLAKWNVDPCCLSADKAVLRLETLRNLGLSRAGPLGDMGLTLGQ